MMTDMVQKNIKIASSVSMTLVLVSFSMLFATFFLGYFIIRSQGHEWPPMGMEPVGLFFPSISTVFIVASSLVLAMFEKFYKIGRSPNIFFWSAFILGWAFVVSQMFFWHSLKIRGLHAHSGIFGSIIYGFTWTHAAHMVLGLILLATLIPLLGKKRDPLRSALRIQNVGMFWHFLGVVWILMFLGLFII